MIVRWAVERDGDAVTIAVRSGGGDGATISLTRRAAASLCAVLGQAAGRRPAATYEMQTTGGLTVTAAKRKEGAK